MIDTDNLRTASLYINNQLLSRGLLQDGQSIDFANPDSSDGDVSATMARIMSIVNDLILRRDRDAEHRESLSISMRSLRAENLKYNKDVARLEDKCAEAQRKLDIAESSEAAAKTQLKSVEAAARGLKDDLARTKALVSQARSSCATEIRRRDRQIDALKKQLGEAGRARGSRGNPAITTISVTSEAGAHKPSPKRGAGASSSSTTATEDYTLRSETNDFLAKLAQDLSEENEAILGAMRRTMVQLREMSGWNADGASGGEGSLAVKQPGWEDMASELDSVLEHMKTILTNPSFVPIEEVMVREEEINRLKDGWVRMEDRWKDAVRLIDGWRKRMAANGRPICDEELQMGLRLSPVRVQDAYKPMPNREFHLSAVAEEEVEEEQMATRDPSPCPSVAEDEEDEQEESLDLVPADEAHAHHPSHVDYEENSYQENDTYNDDYEEDEDEPNVQILHDSSSGAAFRDSSPLPEPPQLSPLKNSPAAGNRGNAPSRKTKAKTADFTTIIEENTWDLSADTAPPQPPPHRVTPAKQQQQQQSVQAENQTIQERGRSTRTSLDDALLPKLDEEPSATELEPRQEQQQQQQQQQRIQRPHSAIQLSPRRGVSRLPLPRNAESAPQQSPLTMATIAAKLAASEREADAARVRAKLKAVRGTRGVARPTAAAPGAAAEKEARPAADAAAEADREQLQVRKCRGATGDAEVDPVKHDPSPPNAGGNEEGRGQEQEQEQGQEQQIKVEKRKRDRRTSKATSRRRSTLSPWELESLISGKVQ